MKTTLHWILAMLEISYQEAYWEYCNRSDKFWFCVLKNIKDN